MLNKLEGVSITILADMINEARNITTTRAGRQAGAQTITQVIA